MKKLLLSLAILLWLPLQLMAKEYITYHHNDYLGTPVVETNEAGQVIKIDEYSAYGIKDYDQPKEFGSASKIGYTGHQYDAALDLNYMQARYYDPDLGRFLALDPVMFVEDNPLSFNRYAYANNNPYKFLDPDGRFAFLAFAPAAFTALEGALIAAIGAISAAVIVEEGAELVGNLNESNDPEEDTILDIDPVTGKLKGDVPESEEIPDESVEDVLRELEGSLGARQLEQIDAPRGNPNGTMKEQEEHRRYEGHEERIEREGKLYDDLSDRLDDM